MRKSTKGQRNQHERMQNFSVRYKYHRTKYHSNYRSETKILNDEVLKQRQGIIKICKSQINKRKQLYWHSLNCENTAAIYATWIQKDKKVIPKKFLLKFIRNEDPQEKRIRQQAVINEFQNEINLLNVRAVRHHTNCKRTDDEFSDFVEKHCEWGYVERIDGNVVSAKRRRTNRIKNGRKNRYGWENTSKNSRMITSSNPNQKKLRETMEERVALNYIPIRQ